MFQSIASDAGMGDKAISITSTDMVDMAGNQQSIPSANNEGDSICRGPRPKSGASSITNEIGVGPESTIIHTSSAGLLSKVLVLLSEISKLTKEEQSDTYTKIVEMVQIVRRPTLNMQVDHLAQIPSPTAEEWEIAPGRLALSVPGTGRESKLAFSASYLRREVINVELATKISRSQRILNRHIPALHQVVVEKIDANWDCDLTVLEGFVQVKIGQVKAKIGQGGLVAISQDAQCFITNVTHRECLIQIRWADKR
ncbi:hypothetical protein N0V82_006665 [Gnomoniopsis sp. IMI 355080]|nr:hypothetical protein N0V82_006665 [Gnomoniopsis sp. IMI 355080]